MEKTRQSYKNKEIERLKIELEQIKIKQESVAKQETSQ